MHIRSFLTAVSLLLASLVWVAPAGATFSSAKQLSRKGVDSDNPKVAVDPQGKAVIAWTRLESATNGCSGPSFAAKCRIQARVRSKNGALSEIQTLSDPTQHALNPDVGVDKNGNAVVVWLRRDGKFDCEGGFSSCWRVQTRSRAADGTLGAVRTLSPQGQHALFTRVAVDPNGNAVFIWARTQPGCGGSCYVLETRALSANGILSKTQRLSTNSQEPRVAIDANGNAVFAWLRPEASAGIQTRTRSANGTLSAVQTLSLPLPGGGAFAPQLGVTPGGMAVFVWRQQDPTTSCGGIPCPFVFARSRSAAGNLSETQTLSAAGAGVPQVGVDADGDAVVVWTRIDETLQCGGGQNGCFRLEARGRRADGTLGAVQILSDPAMHAFAPQIAVDGPGNAVIVWQRQFPTIGSECGAGCLLIQARSRSAAGVLSPIQTVSDPPGAAHVPHVAADPNGGLKADAADAVAAWSRFDNRSRFCCFRTEAAGQIAPAP